MLALRVLVVGDWFVRAVTLCGQTSLVHALVDEIFHDGIGTLLRQRTVLIGGAGVVGVTSDFDEENFLAVVEHAGNGTENGEADGTLDLVAARRELDALQDLDVVVGHFDKAHAFVRTTVGVIDAVHRLRLLRALVDVVGDPVFVRIRSFVWAAVGVFDAVVDLGLERTLIGFVEDLVVVVVRFGATVFIFEAVSVFCLGLALIEFVRDAVFVGVWTAVELFAAHLAGFVRALVVGVGDLVVVAIGQNVRATIVIVETVDGFLFVFALVLRVENAVLIVVVVETSVVVLETVFVFRDRRTLIVLVVDAVAVFVADFTHERHATNRTEQRNTNALKDTTAATERECERQTKRRDLRAAVNFE